MTETITALAGIFSKLGAAESAVFLIYMIFAFMGYFLLKIWFPKYIEKDKLREERELERLEMLKSALETMNLSLKGNNDIVQNLAQVINSLDSTLEKVSDKLYAHDARSEELAEHTKTIASEVNRLREQTPTLQDIQRLHQRIDELRANIGDKKDVGLIIQKLDQLLEMVANIKGKLL
jgi:septal ring factor EnvC (AmiA/AmiB activator)